MYNIIFKRRAAKELLKLPNKIVPLISVTIDDLAVNPRPKAAKKLKGSKDELWRIRIGDYRVVYVIDDQIRIISIRRIGHRKDIYK